MNISKRLLEIIKFIPKNTIVADIGTDHGYIPIYLIQENIAKKVIATDISGPSLEKTVKYVKELNLEDKIETRLGNGLKVIKPFEVDTVVFAGMGGILIRDLLEENKSVANSINTFIFQPMIAANELRKYLYDNKFSIIGESIVYEDGRYYEIICAAKGMDILEDDLYLDFGKELFDNKHPLLKDFINSKIEYKEDILSKIGLEDGEKAVERKNQVIDKIECYKEVLRNL